MPFAKIDPIRPSSTPGGLQRAARGLPEGADWQGGVSFESNCGGVHAWQCDYSGAEKTIDDLGDNVLFESFLLYAGVRCSGSVSRATVETLERSASIKMARGTSGALARELATGAATGNPSLQSTATDISPDDDICVDSAIAALLAAADECGGGDVMFHAPFVALASLMKYDLVEYVDGRYMLGGHIISIDGYPNAGPDGVPEADDSSFAWIYATGPVEFELDPIVNFSQLTHRINETALIAERLAILRFDPCCVNTIRAQIC